MYTICNTTQDDVLKAVKAMGKLGYKFHITQVGQQFYSSMAKDRTSVPERIDNRKYKHVVSISTCTLHKESCRVAKRKGKKNLVGASIVNVDATGLKLCKVCMS